MLSVRLTAPGRLRVGEAPEPDPAGRALVRVRRVGICGTDLKLLDGVIPVAYPRVMGHEVVGEVLVPGPSATTAAGQRVLVDPSTWCGRCDPCRSDRTHLCARGGLLGRDVDGGFAALVAAPESRLVPVPAAVGDDAAVVLQGLGTCVHAMRSVSVLPGDVAAVVGLGVSGLLFVQLLRARGAAVVGVTRSHRKRQLALDLGAAAVAAPGDAADVLGAVSGGRGADVVVEAAGATAAFEQAVRLARAGGHLVAFGLAAAGPARGAYDLYLKELTVHHPRAAQPGDYRRGVELAASSAVELGSLVTHKFALAEAPAAFAAVREPSSLKVVMDLP
jgi:2-desacetyl-2-hydroxyethyl bacteriochlorophyllide A dehydrogenase